jgi:ABC-2 type transport system permease protein
VDVDSEAAPSAPATPLRLLYWQVRRELWEHRSVVWAPLAVTALVLFASLIRTLGQPQRLRDLSGLDAAERYLAVLGPLATAPAPIMLATFLVGFFYSLDALYGERRDRSILFWKSLPVSDLVTVLSKASIPLVVLPLYAFVLSLATVAVLLLAGTAVLAASGIGPATLWSEYRVLQESSVMIYGLAVHALWFAPLYGWLFVISAWARRMPILWLVLPPVAISVFEHIVSGTSFLSSLLAYRLRGAMAEAFAIEPGSGGAIDRLWLLTPLRLLSSPGLWLGLVFATGCFALAVRLRRFREPI